MQGTAIIVFSVVILLSVFQKSLASGSDTVRVMFYNVENLFDTDNDPNTMDDEFTKEGFKSWNNYRFYRKLNNIAKVILAVGEWNPPVLVGLCEIENRFVLEKLIYHTALKNIGYGIIHADSPDPRGIDVALLYRKDLFSPVAINPLQQNFPSDNNKRTRDILYVKGLVTGQDTLHLFVNHWPSKYGGFAQTQPLRNHVAGFLRSFTDSILLACPAANIIIMGDFNDNPVSESVIGYLGALQDTSGCKDGGLRNLMYQYMNRFNKGTHKYQEYWDIIDQIIVSANLLCCENNLFIPERKAVIFDAPFLMVRDEKYLGFKPNRTFSGPQYLGGYSDHLPVYINIVIQNRGSQ